MWDKIKLRLKSTGAKMTGMRERQGSGPGASSASSFRGDAALPLDAVQGKAEESPEDPAEEGGAIEEGDSLLVPIPDSGPALEEDREAGEMNGDAVKMAAGEKRRRRELERLSRATVEFTYEASPEAKLGEVCLLVCGHWKQWALRKREAREAQAVYKIIMWYTNIKRRKEMADMQELLDLQRRNEEIIP